MILLACYLTYLILNLRFLATSTIYYMPYFEHLNHSKLKSQICDKKCVRDWLPQPSLPMSILLKNFEIDLKYSCPLRRIACVHDMSMYIFQTVI